MRRSWVFAWCVAALWACSAPTGCACGGFAPIEPFTFGGTKLNAAGAARLSQHGFATLNGNGRSIIDFFAPGGDLDVPVSCSEEMVTLGGFSLTKLAVGDTGQPGCTDESCGRMDGLCDAKDTELPVTLHLTAVSFSPVSPDLLEARVTATVQTGRIPISSVGNSLLLCLANQRAKFTVDLDTNRAPPADTDLLLDIKLAIDTRWDQLLSLELATLGNASACSGSTVPPNCIDPADMEILNEGCSALSIASLAPVKSLLINQLATSLKKQISKALAGANCLRCGNTGSTCPSFGTSTSSCDADAGVCKDGMTGRCVPSLIGLEGALDVGQALAGVGAPPGAAVELSIGAGGNSEANPSGMTVGLRAGAHEVAVATCVAPGSQPAPVTLPLPDFDADAPGPYDVGVSVSGQLITETFYRAQQAGALCLQLGAENVSALESSTLATFLPSLALYTEGKSVPLMIVTRPVNAPTATIGAGTFDTNGDPIDPLVKLKWQGLELDVYAQIEDRQTRLFTLAADLAIPISLSLDGCSGFTPLVGDLTGAVTNVRVRNSELLAEPLTAVVNLVPSLLTLAEPQLSRGLSSVSLPAFNGYKLKLTGAKGVGLVSGTTAYQHVGLYAELMNAGQTCTPHMKRSGRSQKVEVRSRADDRVELAMHAGARVSWRVDEGLWSVWQRADVNGVLSVRHPRLRLGGAHRLELRFTDGAEADLQVAQWIRSAERSDRRSVVR